MRVSRDLSRAQSLLGVLVLVLVAGAFIYVLLAMNGPVRVVQVNGDLSADERIEVRDAVALSLVDDYMALDLDDVMQEVLALSWPRDVKVRRTWPSGVTVAVTKDVFVARWGDGGVLNSAGEVIVTPDQSVDALPLIECAQASGPRAMRVFQMLTEVLSNRSLEVVAVRENKIGEWSVEFNGSLSVAFGRDDLLGRLERFVRVYDGVLAERIGQVISVDARYPNGIAVNWRDTPHASGSIQLAAIGGRTVAVGH